MNLISMSLIANTRNLFHPRHRLQFQRAFGNLKDVFPPLRILGFFG